MTSRAKTAAHAHFFAIATLVEVSSAVSNPSDRKAGIGFLYLSSIRCVPLFCGSDQELGGEHLIFYPGVSQGEAFAQTDGRRPVEFFLNQGVVAVAAVDAFGGAEIVVALQLDAGDLFDDVDGLVDGDELVGAEVERLVDVALGDLPSAEGAVVDVHEGAGLLAVAPDLDLIGSGVLGLEDLAADGGGGLFAASRPGAKGAVDVVVAGDAALDAVVLFEVA